MFNINNMKKTDFTELQKVERMKINKKNPFNYLNNLKFTTETIKPIIEYLTTGNLPNLTQRPLQKFIKRFSNDWKYENNNLVFIPLNLTVITEDKVHDMLKELYEDPINSLGKGIQAFYDTVKSKYLGIKRSDVESVLKKQEVYQMSFTKKKINQKPIYAQYPNEKWQTDLIDMNQYVSQNMQYRYILTVIDLFTRKVFAQKLKNKDAESVEEAFNKIIENQSKITPKYIISDNGGEFEITAFYKKHKIKHQKTESHSPTQNGLIENFNGSLRRLIRANFIRNNNLVWINDLQLFLDNYNNRKHKTTGFKPNEIWTPTKTKITNIKEGEFLEQTNEQKLSILSNKTIDKVTKQIDKLKAQTLEIGDFVRVSTSSLNSEVRKNNKAGLSKLVVVKFSAKVYIVDKVVKSRTKQQFALDRYILKDKKGKILTQEFNINKPNQKLKPRLFSITELLKIDKNTVNTRTKQQEDLLNKVTNTNPNDDDVDVDVVVKPRKSERIKKLTAQEKRKQTLEAKKNIQEPVRKSGRARKSNEKLDL